MKGSLALAVVVLLSSAHGVRADDDSPPEPLWVESVTASSTLADKHDAYNPALTLVPKLGTDKAGAIRYDSAWCEGKKDEGIGEGVTITLTRPTTIAKITIKPGVWMTQALFDANNVVTGLAVTTDDGRTLTASPAAKREQVELALGGAPVKRLVVKITAVKKGKMNDSCISEITFGDDNTPAVGFDAAAVAAYPKAVKELWGTLFAATDDAARCAPAVLAKYVDFPFTYVEVENTLAHDEKKRFVRHPHTFKTAAAWQKACNAGQFLGGASTLAGTSVETDGVGKLGVHFDMAMASQTMRLAWRGGAWRLVTFD